MEPYGNMVKKKLIDMGMRQKELAEMVGCSKIYMSYIITGKKSGWKYREKINKILDLKEGA